MRIFECPKCGEELQASPYDKSIQCPECNTYYTVIDDAEFVDGMWRDLSVIKESPFFKEE